MAEKCSVGMGPRSSIGSPVNQWLISFQISQRFSTLSMVVTTCSTNVLRIWIYTNITIHTNNCSSTTNKTRLCSITNNINDASQSSRPNRNGDGATSVPHSMTTHQTLSTIHGNGTHSVLSCSINNTEGRDKYIWMDGHKHLHACIHVYICIDNYVYTLEDWDQELKL